MPQPRGEAVERAPVVEPATGASRPPYDPELVLREHPLEADLICELSGRWGIVSFEFRTLEERYIVTNRMTFTAEHSTGYILTRDDIYAAVRGDVDTSVLTETAPGLKRRQLRVDYPRPHLSTEEAVMVAERWRRYRAQRAEIENARAAATQAQTNRQERWQQAQQVAQETLARFLTEEQRRTVAEHHYFDIVGSHGSRYRIGTGSYSGNVRWIDHAGNMLGEYCGHCGGDHLEMPVPIADHNLTQMLELVTDEITWIDTAIRQCGPYPDAWYHAMPRKRAESFAYEENRHRNHYPTYKPLPCPCGCGQKVPYAW